MPLTWKRFIKKPWRVKRGFHYLQYDTLTASALLKACSPLNSGVCVSGNFNDLAAVAFLNNSGCRSFDIACPEPYAPTFYDIKNSINKGVQAIEYTCTPLMLVWTFNIKPRFFMKHIFCIVKIFRSVWIQRLDNYSEIPFLKIDLKSWIY